MTSLPPGGEISKHLAPDMPKKKSPKGGKTGVRRPRKVPPLTNVINPKPVTFQVDDDNDFKLHPRAKGSFMFVNWNILRRLIRTKKLKIWAHEKTRQTSLLVSWADQMSYVTEAIGKSK